MRPVSTRTLDHGVHSAVRYMHAVFITTTSWPQIRPLIVEVKNRVRRVSTPPPFYDVVQAVTYCRMVGCDAADLVQVRIHHMKSLQCARLSVWYIRPHTPLAVLLRR